MRMKALVKPEGGAGLELTDVPVPRPGATPPITHRPPLERFEEVFAPLKSGDAGKMILYV